MTLPVDEIIARLGEELRAADSDERALLASIQTVCSYCQVPYGEVWTNYAETPSLYLKTAWYLPELDLADFVSASRKIAFASGVGLPGRVWQSRRQEVIRDLRVFPEFSRQSMALAAGFRAAVGSPVFRGDEIAGVLVFMASKFRRHQPELIERIAALTSAEISKRWPGTSTPQSGAGYENAA